MKISKLLLIAPMFLVSIAIGKITPERESQLKTLAKINSGMLILRGDFVEQRGPRLTIEDLRFIVNQLTNEQKEQVIKIYLMDNDLTKVSDDLFSGFKNLRHLFLQRNKLKAFNINSLRGLTNLIVLNLDGNPLTPESIAQLKKYAEEMRKAAFYLSVEEK